MKLHPFLRYLKNGNVAESIKAVNQPSSILSERNSIPAGVPVEHAVLEPYPGSTGFDFLRGELYWPDQFRPAQFSWIVRNGYTFLVSLIAGEYSVRRVGGSCPIPVGESGVVLLITLKVLVSVFKKRQNILRSNPSAVTPRRGPHTANSSITCLLQEHAEV